MAVYYTVAGVLSLCCLLFDGTSSTHESMNSWHQNGRYFKGVFYSICCFLLWFITAFRAKFSVDYANYEYIFYMVSNMSWKDIWQAGFRINLGGSEIGFNFLVKTISTLVTDPFGLIVFMASCELIPAFIVIGKKSRMPFISLLLLFTIGFFFHSFVTMRSSMVYGLGFLLINDIEKNNLKTYMIKALILSLFHITALVYIPIFFLIRKDLISPIRVIILITVFGLFIVVLGALVKLADSLLYSSFYSEVYSGSGMQGGAFGQTVPALTIAVFLLLFQKNFYKRDYLTRVILNGTLLWFCVSVIVLSIRLMSRFTDLLCIYPTLFVPELFYRMFRLGQNKYIYRLVMISLTTTVLLVWLWFILKDSPYRPYRFIWD